MMEVETPLRPNLGSVFVVTVTYGELQGSWPQVLVALNLLVSFDGGRLRSKPVSQADLVRNCV